jgi:PAS domain S-box-containing protein
MEPDESPSGPRERRRQDQPVLEPVAWVVLIIGVIGSVLGFFITRDQVVERERDELMDTASMLLDEYDETLSELQGVVDEVSGAVIATDANEASVEGVLRSLLANNAEVRGVSVMKSGDGSLSTYAERGPVAAIDIEITDEQSAQELEELVEALSIVDDDRFRIVATDTVDQFHVVDVALELEAANGPFIILAELAIPTVQINESLDSKVDYAIYLGDEPNEDELLFATTDDLPLTGSRVTVPVAAGEQEATLVVAQSGPLVSRTETALSWAILIGGLLLTAIFTPLVQTFTRRRRQMRALRAENAELDEALAVSRRIEHELRASEQRFRSVLTSSPDVILWMDPDGTHVQVLNRTDFLGHQPATIEQAEAFTSLIHIDDWPGADAGFKALRWSDPGTITEFEFRLRDAAGGWRWVRARGGVAQLDDETPYILAVLTEITEQKREEQRRSELEAQLVQSQRLEAVGQLAGGVAHDFNNILAAILSGAELVLDDVPAGEARDDLEEIQRTARRGAELSRQLLLFSRGEAGSSPEVLDVNEVVIDIERMLERAIGEHISLRTELANDLKLVFADRNEIERIVMNLSINARDAMTDAGTITIRTQNRVADDDYISRRVDLEAGDYVQIEVTDDGVGMPPEVQRRAFEPFFSTKDVGKGTGLGLATVYGIVQRARGHIEIESIEGEGTTIRLLLPITRIRDVPDSIRRRERAPRGTGEHVLVVEDEPAVRDTTARLLERRGYVVATAEDGQDAATVATTQRFDLLLTDVLLPGGMSGKDVADVLRRSQPHLAILFMTGHSGEVLEGVGLRPGDPRIIHKPFDEDQLLAMVRTAIDEVFETI